MADLTRDASLNFIGEIKTARWVLDNSAAQTIYRGQPMILDVGTDTVYVRGFVDATVVASTDIFIGIALAAKTVATTDTETDNTIQVATDDTIVGFVSSVYTDADVGDTVYMSDSATLSATAADNPQLGKLYRVMDGYCYVKLGNAPLICSGA